jgi:4-hydroxy-2-oxoheptanedioate aldolase
MYASIAAVSSAGSSPIVRIPASSHWMLKRALDAGAHAVMVPMIESAEQAREVVAACKYPARLASQQGAGASAIKGNRSAGAMFAHHAFSGQSQDGLSLGMANGRDYYLKANDAVMVCVQVESRKGVENIEEIAAVSGLDMLFVGPNDLASTMGYVSFDHAMEQEVQDAVEVVRQVGKKHGKYVGMFCLGAEEAAKRWSQGWEFVNLGADLVAIASWMGGEMAKLQKSVEEGRPTKDAATASNSGGYGV